jgi:type IV pilus assembly protein PilO
LSTAAVVPPNSSSLLRHAPRLTAKARRLLTVVNLHFAGLAALAVIVLYLVAHLVFVMQQLSSHSDDALSQERTQLIAAQLAAKPLRGLDTKLAESTKEADRFYQKRLPYAISEVLAELGALTKKEGVRLTRIQYGYAPILSGASALTEVRMDVNVSGEYRPMVQFINAAERDKLFFVIGSINFTGQQTGQVNLRLRLTTYQRAPVGNETTAELPAIDATGASATPVVGAKR